MRSILISVFLTIGIAYLSCEKDRKDQVYRFEAKVLGQNTDCGEYEVKFLNNLEQVVVLCGKSVIDSVYIAGNLPNDLKISGQTIYLNIRKPLISEFTSCSMMGPTLNWVWVKEAKIKSNL